MRLKLLVLGSAMAGMVVAGASRTTAAPAGAAPTFNKDVAPIIFTNCVTCHRPNQVAPMSLMSYKEVRPWARSIRNKVMKREMPPWLADPRFGAFKNDRRLSDEQIRTLAAWADAGAPEGDTPLAMQPPPVNDGWSHPSGRPPDLVVAMADAFEGPAQGEIPWFNIYQELPPELKAKEHYIEAIQILPGDLAAVHHMAFGLKPLPPGTKVGRGEAWPGGNLIINGALVDEKTGKLSSAIVQNEGVVRPISAPRSEAGTEEVTASGRPASEFYYCCYVPGGSFRQYPPGGYTRIPQEGVIEWGTHYTLIGRPFSDRTRVGLWFAKDLHYEVVGNAGSGRIEIVQGEEVIDSEETRRRKRSGSGAGPAPPLIPPHTKNFAITAITAYQDDITLYTVWPHMHTRGKEMTYVLTYPDGREQILLSVLDWNYNWQIFYELKEPIKVPAGSTIKTVGSYDNSSSNKWASEPHKDVYWSEQSWDEMYNGFRDYSIDKFDRRSTRRPTAGAGQ